MDPTPQSRASRKIAAILAADVAGYSRLMGEDDEGTLAALKARRAIFDRLVLEHDGRAFGSVGDSLMAQFPSAVNALRCARAIQQSVAEANAPLPGVRRMQFRIGIDLGDVIEEDGTVYGEAVNVAARLQAIAEPGRLLVSGAVYQQVKGRHAAEFRSAGTHLVKNIAEPVRAYAVRAPGAGGLVGRALAFLGRRSVMMTLAYVAGSILLVIAFGRLASAAVPAWARAALITILAAGFSPAMAIAWRYDRRHPAPAWLRSTAVLAALAIGAGVAWLAWRSHARASAEQEIVRPVPAAQPVVAVAPLRNLTSDRRNDWLSEGVANLVRDGMTESPRLVVVSPTRWRTVLRTSAGDTLAAAAKAGIDYVISGEYMQAPDGLLLTARVTDVRSGVELDAHRAPGLTPQTLIAETTRLVLLAKRSLGVPHTETYSGFATDFAVGNMEAYELYLGGLGFFMKFDYRNAERAFRSALELAPQFYMARYRLAHVQVAEGDTEAALATLAAIPEDAPLSRRERLYIDGARALFARDAERALATFRVALAEFPYDIEAQFLMALAHDVAYDDEAVIGQFRRMLEQEPQNERIWAWLGETYLRLGKYAEARDALNHYLALKPEDPFGFTLLGRLAQLEGRQADASRHLLHALELEPDFAPARLALAESEVLEESWEAADARLLSLADDREAPAVFRIDAAFALNGLRLSRGQFAAAARPLVALEREIGKEEIRAAMALAQRGRSSAERGDFVEASSLIRQAVERAPSSATRYLHALGSMRLMQGDAAGARQAASRIRVQTFAEGDSGAKLGKENAERAAAHLEGMAMLVAGDAAGAVKALEQAVDLPGYEYAIYELGLAQALLAAGRAAEALPLARSAATVRDPGDLRLDLGIDRARAVLLEAEILAQLGRHAEARQRAETFLHRWANDDPGQGDRKRAALLTAARAGREPLPPSPSS
ncbi:MAG TPA: tetratricopeptide repeat protein [Steroidobacteraceae bacterium]|nr:tetratricopeptide repeat protein [Steroidobacteraceae bacterium]